MVESNILEMRQINKYFPGVHALDSVDFCVRTGEIHALVGHNGAGKSTLLKILSGIHSPDSGDIVFNGNNITNSSPKEVLDHGISFIYQELNLVHNLSVAENIFLGREIKNKIGLIKKNEMRKEARKILNKLGEEKIDVKLPLSEISVAQQQMVAIAKALDQSPRLLVLDEPTSRLSKSEIEKLFSLLHSLALKNISIIYVSHRLEEIYRIAERVTVLRDGKFMGTHAVKEINADDLVEEMVGERLRKSENANPPNPQAPICLQVNNLKGSTVNNISFYLKQGEVLGIVGAVGSGKTEMIQLLFGLDKRTGGDIEVNGKNIDIFSSQKAVSSGLALSPEDRKSQGLLLMESIINNITLASLKNFTHGGWLVRRQQEVNHAKGMVRKLRIVTPSIRQLTQNLSGGNQQKVVLAKWLSTEAKIFIFDEPTVGVDVQGKEEIYGIVKEIANSGAGVIFLTSDPEEGWSLCSRLLVMFERQIVADVDPKTITLAQLTSYTMGGNRK